MSFNNADVFVKPLYLKLTLYIYIDGMYAGKLTCEAVEQSVEQLAG